MTTDVRRGGVWFVLALALSLGSAVLCAHGCAGASKVRHGDSIDVSNYPKDIQDAYAVFAVRCSRCHTLARPLNARIHDAQHWQRYVTRMRRNPSSGINATNADIILRFLLYYMHERDSAEQGAAEPESEPDIEPTPASTSTRTPIPPPSPRVEAPAPSTSSEEPAVPAVEQSPLSSEPAAASENNP